MILTNGCNTTKSEKFQAVWILSVPAAYAVLYKIVTVLIVLKPPLRSEFFSTLMWKVASHTADVWFQYFNTFLHHILSLLQHGAAFPPLTDFHRSSSHLAPDTRHTTSNGTKTLLFLDSCRAPGSVTNNKSVTFCRDIFSAQPFKKSMRVCETCYLH